TAVEGADIDLAGAVSTVLGLDPHFESEAFSALPTSVRTGRVELAASSLTIPPGERIDTDAVLYFRSGSQLVAGRDDPELSLTDLCGRTVAALEGSVQVRSLARRSRQCRTDGLPPLRIEARSDQEQVTTAVLSGRAAGFLTDTPVAQHTVAEHPGELSLSGRPVDPAPFGMITPPEYPRFAKAVRGAMQFLIGTGYYGAVLDRWQVSDGAIDRARIHWSHSTEVERKARAASRHARHQAGKQAAS
ncbi:MAG: transporter substrate-binding domain-containing protein, partial [Candidatus Nanopelagicales bacterium]